MNVVQVAASSKKAVSAAGVTWPQAFRDVLIASMNRGQLPLLGLIFLLCLVVWRLPEKDVSGLAHELLDRFARGELLAYVFLLFAVFGWYFHARWMRQQFSSETLRIGKEKSTLQSKLSGETFKSSDKK